MPSRSTTISSIAPVCIVFVVVVSATVLFVSKTPTPHVEETPSPQIEFDKPECSCRDLIRKLATDLETHDLSEESASRLHGVASAFHRGSRCVYYLQDEQAAESVRSVRISVAGVEDYAKVRELVPASMIPEGDYEQRIAKMLSSLDLALEQTDLACDARQGPRDVG